MLLPLIYIKIETIMHINVAQNMHVRRIDWMASKSSQKKSGSCHNLPHSHCKVKLNDEGEN